LVNVLAGHMSIVGPRPLQPVEVELLTPDQQARHRVRPGMTGLWQVSGRNATTWEERLRLDLQYVSTWSMRQDLRILARTVVVVLRREGAY
jgi:lipopolysaccharide/colanic/teichoic acid biosynthesis glycosyltransferase